MPPYLEVAASFRDHSASVRGLPGVQAKLLHDCPGRHPLTYIVIGPHSTYRLTQRLTELDITSAAYKSSAPTLSSAELKESCGCK